MPIVTTSSDGTLRWCEQSKQESLKEYVQLYIVKIFAGLPVGEALSIIAGRFRSRVDIYERQPMTLNILFDTLQTDADIARSIAKLEKDAGADNTEVILTIQLVLRVPFTQATEIRNAAIAGNP